MLGVAVFLTLAAIGALMLPLLVRVDEEHALAGLFGEPLREDVIARRTTRLLEGAEAVVRLARFVDALKTDAWNGVPFAMRRRSSGWCEWSFADGSRWLVRHRARPPRDASGVVVATATTTRTGVAVDAYGPGGAFPEETLEIVDATELPPLDRSATRS